MAEPPLDADLGTLDALGQRDASSGPDAACWWCGLPTGTISVTFVLAQSDCVSDFADGDEATGSADFAVVVAGTSPNGLHVDAYSAGSTSSFKTCTVPVAADGSWSCSADYGVSSTEIAGQLQGLTMHGTDVYHDSQRDTICSNLVGVGQP